MPFDVNRIESFQDAVVTVMGLGRFRQGSGVGAAKWLMRHGAQIVITDLKTREELQESVEEISAWYEEYRTADRKRDIYQPVFVLGEHRAEDFMDVDLVMQNPDVQRSSPFLQVAREHGVPIESDMSLFFRHCPFPICAVTGTRGKSTTTTLIGNMLRRLHPDTITAGNIAVSPLEFLDDVLARQEPLPIVLELSSWMIESLAQVTRPADIAVLTNIYPDHLNRYPSYEAYQTAKEALFQKQTASQIAVFNADQPLVREIAARAPATHLWASASPQGDEDGTYLSDTVITFRRGGKEESILPVSELALGGAHNVENVLCAVSAAMAFGATAEVCREELKTFHGLPGRQELIAEKNGILFINDTTATSPDGAIAALDRFSRAVSGIVLLAGGASKELSFEALGPAIARSCKFVVYLDGNATDDLMREVGETVPSIRVFSMAEAMQAALSVAKPGDAVLLSPGTASFGMFKNEFDRGDQFVAEVKKIA